MAWLDDACRGDKHTYTKILQAWWPVRWAAQRRRDFWHITTGAGNDIERATDNRSTCREWGMSDFWGRWRSAEEEAYSGPRNRQHRRL